MSSVGYATPERPWLGLSPFSEGDAEFFWGREEEIRALETRSQRNPLTILYSPSGNGKSSLLAAGLVPALRSAGSIPIILPRFSYEKGCSPLVDQATGSIQALLDISPGNSRVFKYGIWETFHSRGLLHKGSAISEQRFVLILDQFEEVFTLGEDKQLPHPTATADLMDAIASLVENRPPLRVLDTIRLDRSRAGLFNFDCHPANVILALREEFLPRLERWRRIMPSLVDSRIELRGLRGPQAKSAILTAGGRRPGKKPIVSDAVASALVRFVAGAELTIPLSEVENVPPLLSLVCERLNERRFHSERMLEEIPIEWIERPPSGGDGQGTAAEAVLRTFYESCFQAHPASARALIEDALSSDEGYRETLSQDALVKRLRGSGVKNPEAVLDSLVGSRLLIKEERGGVPRIEFTHDILSRLARLSRQERKKREEVQAQERLKEEAERAREAEQRRREAAERLQREQELLKNAALAEREEAERAREAERRKREEADAVRRRLFWVALALAGSTAFLVVSLYRQHQLARDAEGKSARIAALLDATKDSEAKAKKSEAKAMANEARAKKNETRAKDNEARAKENEEAATKSEKSAAAALLSAETERRKADDERRKADNARQEAEDALQKVEIEQHRADDARQKAEDAQRRNLVMAIEASAYRYCATLALGASSELVRSFWADRVVYRGHARSRGQVLRQLSHDASTWTTRTCTVINQPTSKQRDDGTWEVAFEIQTAVAGSKGISCSIAQVDLGLIQKNNSYLVSEYNYKFLRTGC